jgi:hypothetical protein
MTIFKAFKLPTPEPIVYFNLRTGKDGKLSLSACVSKELGLDLDTSGKIKLK